MRKINQKTTSVELQGNEIGMKGRDPQKTHLRLLLNVHTEFQLSSSIWRRDRGGTALFQGQKGAKSHIALLLIIDLGD